MRKRELQSTRCEINRLYITYYILFKDELKPLRLLKNLKSYKILKFSTAKVLIFFSFFSKLILF